MQFIIFISQHVRHVCELRIDNINTPQNIFESADYTIDNHPSWKFLSKTECGKSRSVFRLRILGGKKAAIGEHPWMARVGIKRTSIFGPITNFVCGGSLISRYYVVTAAHCGTDNNIVRLGENTENKRNCDVRGCAPDPQDIAIERFFDKHYDSGSIKNDIMLILLQKPAVFSEYLLPICLLHGSYLTKNVIGELVTVAGWGLVSNREGDTSSDLMTVDMPVLQNEICNNKFERPISDDQYCAGFSVGKYTAMFSKTVVKDSCEGDSGGPMMIAFREPPNRQLYLIGITSFGLMKCGQGPGVYTRVASHMKWILDTIRK
ncbi:hypothetical protein JTB14_027670 [Gonioctena quinquepunctata]|nr:hypothetical protein JTB14_027670 [Gonioctena quinquepunctata]